MPQRDARHVGNGPPEAEGQPRRQQHHVVRPRSDRGDEREHEQPEEKLRRHGEHLPRRRPDDAIRGKDGAQLRIDTNPTGATVIVNGAAAGESPLTMPPLKAGRYLVTARMDGHKDARESVQIASGEKRALQLTLEEITGLVLIRSKPDGADVTLDGAFRGKTPLMMPDFPVGTHRVVISRPGFFTKEVEISVKDRAPQLIDADLTPDAAMMTVNSTPAGAAILINGANRGVTPARLDALPSGEVQVELRLPGCAPYRQAVKLNAGQEYTVNAAMAAQPGTLRIVTSPDKAKVYIDDQLRGESPVQMPGLMPGPHRVRIELRGHESDARTVQVKPGETVTEEFRLQQNSGVLILTTEPAGVKVLVDGEEQGETQAAPAGLVSRTFEARFLGPGEHTLQLVRPGWTFPPKKFSVESGKAVTLHEKMTRLFIPDVQVRTRDEIITGVLLREYASGDLEIERQPGVIVRISEGDVLERKAIKQGGP